MIFQSAVHHNGKPLRTLLLLLLVGLVAYNAFLYQRLYSTAQQVLALQRHAESTTDDGALLASLAALPESALKSSPELAELLSNTATRLVEQGNPAEAETVLRRSIEIAPRAAYPIYAYAAFLRHHGRYEEALRQLNRARVLSPQEARVPLMTGMVLYDLNRKPEAEQAYHAALALDPMLSDAYLGLAYVCQTPARHREALQHAQQFIRLRPRSSAGHVMLARLYLDLRSYPEAEAEARTAARLRPSDPAAHHLLGLALASTSSRVDDAIGSMERAVRLDPSYSTSHYELGRLYLRKGDLQNALAEIRRAVEMWPGNGDYHWTLMQALRRSGDATGAEREGKLARYYTAYKRAQSRLSKRIQDHPRDVNHYLELARLHQVYGQPDRAARVLRDAQAISPDDPRLRDLLPQAEHATARKSTPVQDSETAPRGVLPSARSLP